jgi:hypothetical protein
MRNISAPGRFAKFAAEIARRPVRCWKFISGAFYPVGRAEFNGCVELAEMTLERVLCIQGFFDIKNFRVILGAIG